MCFPFTQLFGERSRHSLWIVGVCSHPFSCCFFSAVAYCRLYFSEAIQSSRGPATISIVGLHCFIHFATIYLPSKLQVSDCVLLTMFSFHSAVRREKPALSLDSWGVFSPIFVLLLFRCCLLQTIFHLFSLLGCVWQAGLFSFPFWAVCDVRCVISGRGWWRDVLTSHVGKYIISTSGDAYLLHQSLRNTSVNTPLYNLETLTSFIKAWELPQ